MVFTFGLLTMPTQHPDKCCHFRNPWNKEAWQHQNLLLHSTLSTNEFTDEGKALDYHAMKLLDECLVVLVGNMIIEDVVSNYWTRINNFDGFKVCLN